MLLPAPPLYPRRRKPRANDQGSEPPAPPPPPPPPAALTLVAASYFTGPAAITLQFDRAIDLSAFDGSQVAVHDAVLGIQYLGTGGATLLGVGEVEILLEENGALSRALVHLTASAATGIVAAPPDAGTWAGVTNLQVPWP